MCSGPGIEVMMEYTYIGDGYRTLTEVCFCDCNAVIDVIRSYNPSVSSRGVFSRVSFILVICQFGNPRLTIISDSGTKVQNPCHGGGM